MPKPLPEKYRLCAKLPECAIATDSRRGRDRASSSTRSKPRLPRRYETKTRCQKR